jgi:hypothetical protein
LRLLVQADLPSVSSPTKAFPFGQLEVSRRFVTDVFRKAADLSALPSLSYSKYLKTLEPYFEKNTPGFNENRSTMREILQKDNDLAEIVQLVGKSALSEADKATLEVATMIKVSNQVLKRQGRVLNFSFCLSFRMTSCNRTV